MSNIESTVSFIDKLSSFSYKNCFLIICFAGMLYILSYIFKSFVDDDNYLLASDNSTVCNAPVSFISYLSSFISLGLIIAAIALFIIGVANIGPRAVSDLKTGVHSSSNGFVRNMVGEDTMTVATQSLRDLGIQGESLEEIVQSTKESSARQSKQLQKELRRASDMIQY